METQIASPEPPAARMHCMEIWGGNCEIAQSVRAPGLEIMVFSKPHKASQVGGGDIYYLTSCASGRISRMLLADVSGHGASAAGLAVTLRDLLRQHVNTVSQERFVTQMNRQFKSVAAEQAFATAVVATFFEPKRRLSISVAGHPYPIYFCSDQQQWLPLDPAELQQGQLSNLPLGIVEESDYPGRNVVTKPGDMFLLYSDALIESPTTERSNTGIKGIVDQLNAAQLKQPEEIAAYLLDQVGANDTQQLEDDVTLILCRVTEDKVRWRDNLLAPIRLFQPVKDNTRLAATD